MNYTLQRGPSPSYSTQTGALTDRTYSETVNERTSDSEEWKARGVFLRVFVYVFATHLFAGFIWLLFYVGGHAPK